MRRREIPTPSAASSGVTGEPTFFATPARWRAWLERNHGRQNELWVGFHKKANGHPSITWPESVDQALCFGWIDGIRKSLGETSYVIRFTPRRQGSIWSAVNIRRLEALIRDGVVAPAGLAAYARRTAAKSAIYAYEQDRKAAALPDDLVREFKRNRAAWAFHSAQPPGYQRTAAWWVLSAKQDATRRKRFATLVADSAAGQRIGQLRRHT